MDRSQHVRLRLGTAGFAGFENVGGGLWRVTINIAHTLIKISA